MSRPHHRTHDSGSSGSAGGSGTEAMSIPLIDFSRTPSPSPYRGSSRSGPSDDELDEDDSDVPLSLRPLVVPRGRGWWGARLGAHGGLGQFLFGTWTGWQVYVALLVLYVGAVEYALVLLNRFILWTGVYKFPYPVSVTFVQMLFTHGWLLLAASLTRMLAGPLRKVGLQALVAPAYPINARSSGYISRPGLHPKTIQAYLFSPTGGIAGGGYLEFDRKVAMTVLPLAVVYVGKVLLSNMSYAWTTLPLYTLSRIGNVPVTLFVTGTFTPATHSVSTLSSTLTAVLNLLIASIRNGLRVTWESILAGVASTFFVAVYPMLLQRVHHKLTSALVPQGDNLIGLSPGQADSSHSGARESTRAYWQLLHYLSLLSIAITAPFTLMSGEIFSILRNCYFLDVPWFWFLMLCSSLASFAVFSITLAFVRATSPLTANFVKVPRQALQLTMLSGKLPVHAWIGIAFCWVGSAWFALARRQEGRRREAARLGGR